MKKFLVVLLSLGLILAFSMTASAQPSVKFAGSYYLSGVYWDNPTNGEGAGTFSRAFFYQRFRLQPTFAIAEGLTFTARMDTLEKQWGQTDWKGGYSDETLSRKQPPAIPAARGVQESIEFERAYVTFKTAIGGFQVGYQGADEWGTAFGDNGTTRPRIFYSLPVGPLTLGLVYEKYFEADTTNVGTKLAVDADYDTYALVGVGKFTGGEAGLALKYYLNKSRRVDLGFNQKVYLVSPYAKATFGPVYVEAEASYFGGKAAEFVAGGTDVDQSSIDAYVMAKVKLGPANVGGLFGYSSGDDLSDKGESKTSPGGGGTSWNPAILLMNDDLSTWSLSSAGMTTQPIDVTSRKQNMMIAQVFGDFNPTPKLNLGASVTYAKVNEKRKAVGDVLGTEFDVTTTYKIYDNLSYMVGAGYLLTGDYFKGASATREVGNDYMLLNKLTLNF